MKTFSRVVSSFASSFTVSRFPDPPSVAQAAAAEWLHQLETDVDSRKPYLVALSGGRIARLFFTAVTELVKNERKLFERVHFFWGDERCVPPSDPESNFGMARDLLLQPLNIPPDRIHRIKGEEEPKKAATDAEDELRGLAARSTLHAPRSTSHQPVLDMIFLGMGEEGHVASLFPNEFEDTIASPAVYRPVVASKPPPQRVTLGYPAIAAARQVWLLASGDGKEKALQKSLGPEGRTPLWRVLKSRTDTKLFTDLHVEAT